MLPDLWRMADRRVRPHRDPLAAAERDAGPKEPSDPKDLADVLSGIAHHVRIDRWFHQTDVFTRGERFAADRLRAARVAAPRLPLFAHVLWEMCLDGALVRSVGLAPVLAALREGFARTAEGA